MIKKQTWPVGAPGPWVGRALLLWLVQGAQNVVAAAAGDASRLLHGASVAWGKKKKPKPKQQHYLLASLIASVMPPTHSF